MTVIVPGFATSRKTPGVFLNVILGGAASSPGTQAIKILLMGNKSAAISVAAPTLSLPAGTVATATPLFLASADDAGVYFGLGSEVHVMAREVFNQYPDATVYGIAVAEAGTASDVICTFATSASAAFSVRFQACGHTGEVAVASGDSVTTIATNVCLAINAVTWLPFYAQFVAGVLTATAKNTGPRGNELSLLLSFVSSTGAVTPITTSSTSSGAGTTATMSGGAASGNQYRFAGGATQDTFAAALSAITPTKYGRIVGACTDATNIGLISAFVTSQAGVTIQKRQQAIVATIDTLANATTLATTINNPRVQVGWHYNSPMPACMVAAQIAAARVIGDSAASSVNPLPGEASNPDANLSGLQLATIPVQIAVDDAPTGTEIESALNNGLTVLAESTARPGYTTLVLSITSLSLVLGLQNYAVLFTGYVTTCDYVADGEQAALGIRYAGFRLGANDANGDPPKAALVTTPQQIRASVSGDLKGYEEQGIIGNVDVNDPLIIVEANVLVPGRVDMDIPVSPLPWLTQLVGNIRQTPSI